MNLRDIKTYLHFILLLGVGYVITSCQREDHLLPEPTDIPINFSATSEWPEITKGLIDGISDFIGDGVVVWGGWTTGNTNLDNPVAFGENGTKVYYAPDESQMWSYSPIRYWYQANYLFASAAPASLFTATHVKDGDTNSGYIGSLGGNSLTLNFGTQGFDLSSRQEDIMIAFTQIDNTEGNNINVDIMLQHQLALINLDVKTAETGVSFKITQVKMSGNHSAATSATFTKTAGGINNLWHYTELTGTYKTANGIAVDVTSTASRLFENLLVFPEENCSVTISLQCSETHVIGEGKTGGTKDVTKTVTFTANWVAGKIYTYELDLTSSSIIIGEPTVTDWVTVNNAFGDDIVM